MPKRGEFQPVTGVGEVLGAIREELSDLPDGVARQWMRLGRLAQLLAVSRLELDKEATWSRAAVNNTLTIIRNVNSRRDYRQLRGDLDGEEKIIHRNRTYWHASAVKLLLGFMSSSGTYRHQLSQLGISEEHVVLATSAIGTLGDQPLTR